MDQAVDPVFFPLFESLPRQGPGDEQSTIKAFGKLVDLPDPPEILDVGCGTGSQTLVLAKLTSGHITALDFHKPFIEKLNENARESGFASRISGVVGNMAEMGFEEGRFNLIWSEGAANLMGLKNALNSWRRLLCTRGYLVVSELVLFKPDVPENLKKYWAEAYPDIMYYQDVFLMISASGYEMVDYFPLPHESWWTDYYTPAEKYIVKMRPHYKDRPKIQAFFDSFLLEIDTHRKYCEYYGYGFYGMRKK